MRTLPVLRDTRTTKLNVTISLNGYFTPLAAGGSHASSANLNKLTASRRLDRADGGSLPTSDIPKSPSFQTGISRDPFSTTGLSGTRSHQMAEEVRDPGRTIGSRHIFDCLIWSAQTGACVTLTFLPDHPHIPSSSSGSLGRIACCGSSAGSSSELALPTVKTERRANVKENWARDECEDREKGFTSRPLGRTDAWPRRVSVPWTEAVYRVTSRLL